MLQALKYLPYGTRRSDKYCKPQGPSIEDAKSYSYIVADNVLSLKAPKHRPMGNVPKPLFSRAKGNELEWGFMPHSKDAMPDQSWSYRSLFFAQWAFWGPWLSGCKAELSASVSLLTRSEGNEYKHSSLFHPKVFESAIVDFLNSSYGHLETQLGEALYKAPVNWHTGNKGVLSAGFDIIKNETSGSYDEPTRVYILPIAENHLVLVELREYIYSWNENNLPSFDRAPIEAVKDSFVDGLSIELGQKSLKSLNTAKRESDSFQLTENFAPLKWPNKTTSPVSEEDSQGARLLSL
ncbi:hypothetical protein [Marinimicrobium agarilyticum]|uniref:hypothetical protein n=1 Tax=Marinimicrobium agarilyticum TaxID=306546 RepID=UPI000486F8BC|nr:hypothetical protein [Marinimicrobium agarilyticum]